MFWDPGFMKAANIASDGFSGDLRAGSAFSIGCEGVGTLELFSAWLGTFSLFSPAFDSSSSLAGLMISSFSTVWERSTFSFGLEVSTLLSATAGPSTFCSTLGAVTFSSEISDGTSLPGRFAIVIVSSAMGICSSFFAIILAGGASFFVSGVAAAEFVAEAVLEAIFLVGPLFTLADFLFVDAALFRGGVMGTETFSATLLALACVGRIILARKPSSTLASFLGTGWSLAGCFGGGPMLGRCLLATEDDRPRPFPDVAVRLAGRCVVGGGAFLFLAAAAAVG